MTRPRRGSAVLTALVLLSLVASAMLALGALLSAEARRTRTEVRDAQLRQLLHAGAAAAQLRARQWGQTAPEERFTSPIPGAVSLASIELRTEPAGQDQAVVYIHAHFSQAQAGQQLRFTRSDSGWRPVRAAP